MEVSSSRRGKPVFPYTALALAAVVALVGIPAAAHAATVTYYQAPRASGSLFMEAATKTITGGWVTCSGNHNALEAHGRTTNVTGLSIYFSATANKCGPASFTHPSYIGRSGCLWRWTGSGGADAFTLTCKRVSP